MATINLHQSDRWTDETSVDKHISVWSGIIAFADGQAKNRTLWFVLSLIVQGVFFLPLPAVLVFYFNAPVLCVILTLAFYFGNIILGMGGAGIRTLLACFGLSVILQLTMLVIFTL